MRNLLYIALFYVGMALCAVSDEGTLSVGEEAGDYSVKSRYEQQLMCSHRCNTSANEVQRVVVPTGSVRTMSCNSRHLSNGCSSGYGERLGLTHSGKNRNVIYRLSFGDRAVDYYLYELCRLRI